MTATHRGSPVTLTTAKREVAELENDPHARPWAGELGRIRTEGEGRKSILEKRSEIRDEPLRLLDGNVLGNSGSLLTWIVKNTYTLAKELGDLDYKVSNTTVGTILKQMDFSLQQNKKYIECGDPGPGKNPLFSYITSELARIIGNCLPIISIDARKVRNFKNDGIKYRPKGMPRLVNDHAFCDKKALSYEIYNVGHNEGFVNVGVSTDISQFTVENTSSWRFPMG